MVNIQYIYNEKNEVTYVIVPYQYWKELQNEVTTHSKERKQKANKTQKSGINYVRATQGKKIRIWNYAGSAHINQSIDHINLRDFAYE